MVLDANRRVMAGRKWSGTLVRAVLLSVVAVTVLAGGTPGDRGRGEARQGRAPSGESCTFAVLRRDGVVVPFASYEAGRWQNRWPDPGRRLDIPFSVDATPRSWWLRDRPVGSWTAWPVQGGSRVVHVRNPVNLTVQCERHIGLQTDYSSVLPPVPRDMQPHPKDGLATSGDVAVETVELLAAGSPDWARVLEAIKEPFAAVESKAVARAGDRRGALPDAPRRAQLPLEIEVLFRTPGPRAGTSVLYFEAVRRYSRRPPSSTVVVSVVPDRRPLAYGAGWVVAGAGGALKIAQPLTVEVSDNEREELLYVLPLGTFRLGDRRYWAVQRAGWGYERYEILELTDTEPKVSLKIAGGACR
jgi:hypothetical protein